MHYLALFCALFALCMPRKKKKKKKVTEKCKSGPESQNLQPVKKNIYKKKFRKLVAEFTTWQNLKKMFLFWDPPITGTSHMGRGANLADDPRFLAKSIILISLLLN